MADIPLWIDMDDLCSHKTYVGRVSWPAGLSRIGCGCKNCTGLLAPVASAYVCRLKRCQEQAAAWVKQETGHEGVFVRFEEPSRA